MQNQRNHELATKPIGKLLWHLSLPVIAAQVVNLLYNVVDRMYIGHIPGEGAMALTGLGVTMPLSVLIMAFASLASVGGAPRAAIMMGRGKKEEAERILGNCAAGLTVVAVVLTTLLLLFGRKALMMFGASEETIGYAWDYMSIYAIGTIAVQYSIGLNPFITTQGFTKISMMTVVIGAVCNIVLDPVFIFLFGMGVKGAALATILSQAVSAVWVVRFLTGKKATLQIRKENLRIIPSVYLPCVALGLATFVMQSTESLLTISFNSSLLRYGGDLAVGAMTILSSLMNFTLMPLQGLTQGSQPIISFNYGAGNKKRVGSCYKLLLVVCFSYSTLIWLLAMTAPQLFAMIFTSDPALTEVTVHALRIYMAVIFMFGLQIGCQQTFVSMGNAKTSLFLALLRKVFLLIPLIFILPNFMANKVDAVLLAEPVSDFIAVCVTCTLSFRAMRKYLKEPGKA
ncbi:MAG: MATE family efflux transporter [Clostridia bacterium]|nr:MATE family efflux transporter [Clostridia bacterium]